MSRSEQHWITVGAIVLTGLFLAELLTDYTPVKAGALFLLLAWLPLLVLHELGHALAARWLGWEVQEMVIGFGKELYRFRAFGTLVRIRVVPVEGYVLPNPRDLKHARLKSALIYLSGPGIELLLVLGLWLWLGSALTSPSDAYGVIALQSLALGALMGAGFNLLPYASGNGMSDGLGALVSLFGTDELFRHRLSSLDVRDVRRQLYLERWERAQELLDEARAKYPNDELLSGLQAVHLAATGRSTEAFELLESLGHPNEKPPLVRHDLLLSAAWVVLLCGDRSLLHDAQQACERALIDADASVRANTMLGRVLLERGQPQAALVPLLRAYQQTLEADDETQLLAYLILAARQSNQPELAARFATVLRPERLGQSLRARLDLSSEPA